jgi:(E)-4-hydroxy-3-methylbut-2-enyl-diphosphate synthase
MDHPTIQRRATRPVAVGDVTIGGDAPVSIQSMTNTFTRDVEPTCAQIDRLVAAGADIVRVAVPTAADTAALPAILERATVPIVADVHFHYERALEAVAAGVQKIRLNPGNISDRDKVRRVIDACGAAGAAIRIGVNAGSVLERADWARRNAERELPLVELMVRKLMGMVAIFEQAGFDDLVLSAKSPDPVTTAAVYRRIAAETDRPLHLGVTHAGGAETGVIRSAAALGALLLDGIGDTIRISFAGDPVGEVTAAKELLCCLRLRPRDQAEVIACPTCGRVEVDLERILAEVSAALTGVGAGLRVGVMGCVVNGPGEAESCHVAVCCGRGKGAIYVDGRPVETVPEDQIARALVERVRQYR